MRKKTKMKGFIVVAALLAVVAAEEYCTNDAIAGCKGQTGMFNRFISMNLYFACDLSTIVYFSIYCDLDVVNAFVIIALLRCFCSPSCHEFLVTRAAQPVHRT